MIHTDATAHSPSNKTNKAAAGPERKNKSKKEGTATHLAPKPRVHRKCTLPDIHEKPSTSDGTEMTPDRYEISNTPPKTEPHTHDTHTQQEPTSSEDG